MLRIVSAEITTIPLVKDQDEIPSSRRKLP